MMKINRQIRVLHVITRLVVGGAQENTLYTVKLLNKEKYVTDLISGPSVGEEGSLEQDARDARINLTIVNELVRDPNLFKDIAAFFRLFYLMKSGNYDIVHTHSSKAGILGRFAAKFAGVPVIIHTPHGHVFYGYFNRFVSWFFIVLERVTGSFTDMIITLTGRGREEHIAHKIAKPSKFTVIHSGIDISEYADRSFDKGGKRKELGLGDSDFVIGNIARLTGIKGQEYLIKAAPGILKVAQNAKFLFLGDGPAKNELLELSEKLNVKDKILFLGLRKDIPEIISIMDVFVLPSLNEGMGKVLL
ncbi:glycosyltransferase, partial [Candidatus Auribacterota bacterium]